MMRSLCVTVLSALLTACVTAPDAVAGRYFIGGKEILGADFYLCSSKVKWQGLSIEVEGLESNPGAATKTFAIGKLGYEDQQLRQLDSIAQMVDGWFTQRCADAQTD
jgi:hypothetical protein